MIYYIIFLCEQNEQLITIMRVCTRELSQIEHVRCNIGTWNLHDDPDLGHDVLFSVQKPISQTQTWGHWCQSLPVPVAQTSKAYLSCHIRTLGIHCPCTCPRKFPPTFIGGFSSWPVNVFQCDVFRMFIYEQLIHVLVFLVWILGNHWTVLVVSS